MIGAFGCGVKRPETGFHFVHDVVSSRVLQGRFLPAIVYLFPMFLRKDVIRPVATGTTLIDRKVIRRLIGTGVLFDDLHEHIVGKAAGAETEPVIIQPGIS